MSRRELAEAVNAWLWETTRQRYELDAHTLARYERGAVRWPGAAYRSGLRHVLGTARDAELGFWPARQHPAPTQPRPAPTNSVQSRELTDALTHSTISATTLDHMERAVFSYTTRYCGWTSVGRIKPPGSSTCASWPGRKQKTPT